MHFSDIIRIPFGYLLDWLYMFTTNYGLALILFSLIVKVVLLPLNAKSKKSMLKMSRVAPMAKALEAKYGDDKQKYQMELMKLYKEEGVSATGGCLWSFIPLLILLPLYHVIREPITYMMHIPADIAAQMVEVVIDQMQITAKLGFEQLQAAQHIGECAELLLKEIPALTPEMIRPIDFNFLGINLASIPTWKVWTITTWSGWGGVIMAVLSGGSNMLSMWVSQKLNSTVSTDKDGEVDQAAAKMTSSMNTMMWMMPIMSVIFGFTFPVAITIYWIAQALFTMVFDAFLTKRYGKMYAEEDAARRERAAAEAAVEAERERIRAAKRAANPDGIVDNTSKKKRERQEREEHEEAARRYACEKAGIDPDAPKEVDTDKCPSGIQDRPFCKGRAYDPNRYSRK